MTTEISGIPSISNITTKPLNTAENLADIPGISNETAKPLDTPENLAEQDKCFHLLVCQDIYGKQHHELFKTTGNISSGLIGNLDDAKNIMANSEDRYHIAQQSPDLKDYLKLPSTNLPTIA